MNTYVVPCKQGFTLSGQEAILPLKQTYVVAYYQYLHTFDYNYLQIEQLWQLCQSELHLYPKPLLSNYIYYNWDLCFFSDSSIIRYINNNLSQIISAVVTFFLSFFTEICQLRLDFTNFDIVETTLGVCTDSLTIAGPTGRNPMDLCGTLTGMHGK